MRRDSLPPSWSPNPDRPGPLASVSVDADSSPRTPSSSPTDYTQTRPAQTHPSGISSRPHASSPHPVPVLSVPPTTARSTLRPTARPQLPRAGTSPVHARPVRPVRRPPSARASAAQSPHLTRAPAESPHSGPPRSHPDSRRARATQASVGVPNGAGTLGTRASWVVVPLAWHTDRTLPSSSSANYRSTRRIRTRQVAVRTSLVSSGTARAP